MVVKDVTKACTWLCDRPRLKRRSLNSGKISTSGFIWFDLSARSPSVRSFRGNTMQCWAGSASECDPGCFYGALEST